MANVTCHIDGLNEGSSVLGPASALIDQVRATGKSAGVIWVEFFAADGETLAQVHFIPERLTAQIRAKLPQLRERF